MLCLNESQLSYTLTEDVVLSSIRTRITDSQNKLAALGNHSSVIYIIKKIKVLPTGKK